MEERRNHWTLWIALIALLLLTRVPAASQYLSIDNVNLAFSLENFDPLNHQPQPPGYPFFVALARGFNIVFRDAERTFLVLSVLVSGLCLALTFALGKRMFSPWVGAAAAFLVLVNPVFWFSGLEGPLRPHLALFSLLTAYWAWRCRNGEKQYLYWSAAALGFGSGFRPELLVLMFPVWLLAAWIGTRSIRSIVLGLALMGGVVLVWISALVIAVGGADPLWRLLSEYLVDQSRGESVLLGGTESDWMRQLSRLVIWNALAVIGWFWAAPLFFKSERRVTLGGPESVFMLVWLAPGLAVQALIHVAAPGHTLFSIPALCLVGAYVLYASLHTSEMREIALCSALVLNVMLFLNFVPLPTVNSTESGAWRSLRNAWAFGIFETSLGQLRWLDDINKTTLKEIREFTPPDRPALIVTTDAHRQTWFMNWRIARYYLPDYDIWVVTDQKTPRVAYHVRRDKTLETAHAGSVAPVPAPKGGRILWLLERDGPFHKALSQVKTLTSGSQIVYSDLSPTETTFRVLEFEFVPTEASSTGVRTSGIQ